MRRCRGTGLPTPSTSAGSEAAPAQLFDGETATRHLVIISTWAGGLQLAGDFDQLLARSELRILAAGATRTVLGHAGNDDWRLIAEPPLPPDWLRGIRKAGATQPRDLRLLALAATAATAMIGSLWLWGGALMAEAAPLVPDAVTEPLGRGMVKQLVGHRRCDSPTTDAVLARLAARLQTPRPLTITIADWPIANAFAAPGGQIMLTRGLIEAASGPDEIAGVLAHEIGHVAGHHPTRALIRTHGLSLLAGSLGGQGAELADIGLLLAATRNGEREADAHALTALVAAGISSQGLQRFFERQQQAAKPGWQAPSPLLALGNWARTHPPDAERLALIRAAGQTSGSAAMPDADWAALRGVCAGGG
ncbi:MAG: hypothetical protein DI568_01510 [Sphingomonas sp.]|nr:MAG: hypothetical protein DI568_01510 [Sphingomonas sp.]